MILIQKSKRFSKISSGTSVEIEAGRKISSSSEDEEALDVVSSSVKDEASEESVGNVKVKYDHCLGNVKENIQIVIRTVMVIEDNLVAVQRPELVSKHRLWKSFVRCKKNNRSLIIQDVSRNGLKKSFIRF